MIVSNLGAVLLFPHSGSSARLPEKTAPRGLHYLNLLLHLQMLTVCLVHFPHSLPFASNW